MSDKQIEPSSTKAAEALTAPALAALTGIRHAFFTRRGGCSQGLYHSLNGGLGSADSREAILENRKRIAAHFGLAEERLVTLYQVHSADVVAVEAPFPVTHRPQADAMVTNRPEIILGIATADCGPLLFADPYNRVIGAAHSGWKGAFSGVLEATIEQMEKLGAKRQHITVALGPTISRSAYEVGPEFIERFLAADKTYERFFNPAERKGYMHFDLPAFIAMRAHAAGISSFEDLGLCTYNDEERFFSYRRSTHRGEKDYGRLISSITLQEYKTTTR